MPESIVKNKTLNYETNPAALKIAKFASSSGAFARLCARNYFLFDKDKRSARAVIVAKDPYWTGSFLDNFWFDYTEGRSVEQDKIASFHPDKSDSRILCVEFPAPYEGLPPLSVLMVDGNSVSVSKAERTKNILKYFDDQTIENSSMFYLDDVKHMSQSAEKLKLERDIYRLLKIAGRRIFVFQMLSVIEDRGVSQNEIFRGFIGNLNYLKNILPSANLPVHFDSVLVNCTDLGISILGDLYLRNDYPLKILENTEFIEKFKKISDGNNISAFVEELMKV
ncbi:MAG: hypothetical protein LBR53_07375 [Deltaproteobacteria bacterium]|jgi:hypothetical protein|nr:hypothetical protein [Deltaproteobacteria bacterium]